MEETVSIPGPFGGSQTLQVSALGRSKAVHEFLVLHYFGVDCAMHWDVLSSEVLPAIQLPGASARRASALEMFGASHIAPSHRRMPHVLWTDSMTLIWNLLMGGRMGRYMGSPDTLMFFFFPYPPGSSHWLKLYRLKSVGANTYFRVVG